MKKIGVGIIGGTGFGAGELLRLLLHHPQVEVCSVVSSSSAGQEITKAHPHLRALYTLCFDETLNSEKLSHYEEVVIFSAIPHGKSGIEVSEIHNRFPKWTIIDLSGDLRLKNIIEHTKHYPHSEEHNHIRTKTVYGLAELNRDSITQASIIANPGCLATAAILALAPFAGCPIEKTIMLHLATGSSGSGREPKATTHHPVRHANFYAYKPLHHQHVPEIVECLETMGLEHPDLQFVPHSLPVSRGILCTAFLQAVQPVTIDLIRSQFEKVYANAPFVRLCEVAELENVVGSNFCDISIAVHDKTIVIHAAIDNLVKGMAGQAVQNMNINLGLVETTGLWFGGVRPV